MNPEKSRLVTDPVREGQRKAGRLDCEFDIAPTVFVRLVDPSRGDLADARQPMKANLALYIGGMGARGKNFYNDYCKRLGYEEAAVKIQDAYLEGRIKEATALVPDKLVDELFLVGTEGDLRDRIGAWRAAGKNGEVTTMLIFCRENRALEILAEELL